MFIDNFTGKRAHNTIRHSPIHNIRCCESNQISHQILANAMQPHNITPPTVRVLGDRYPKTTTLTWLI